MAFCADHFNANAGKASRDILHIHPFYLMRNVIDSHGLSRELPFRKQE